jgi:hypothetical protein
LHMLLWLYIHVSRACFKCFICFQTYVTSVLSRCCICCKCFICFRSMLQWFHLSIVKVDRRCRGSLSPWWSSCYGSLVWRRWRSQTPERWGRNAAADRPGFGARWARAWCIGQDGTRASMLCASSAGAGSSIRTDAAFGQVHLPPISRWIYTIPAKN